MAKKMQVFFVFLLLASLAYAQGYELHSGKFQELKEGNEKIEFEFYNGTYSICESEQRTIPILVVNKNEITDKYSLESTGASWINLGVKEFSLPKRQSGVVSLNLYPGQNTNGRHTIKVLGLSLTGNVKKELILDINVEKCYALNLRLDKEEDKVCGGTKKQYNGEILNAGKQEDAVELAASGQNWISIDKNTFLIAPGAAQKFSLYAEPPASAKGLFILILNSASKKLPLVNSEKKLTIEVVPKYDCYQAEVITKTKIKNYYSDEYLPIKIRNRGIKQADYEISLEAPSWISIEPKQIIINPEQLGSLNLKLSPDAETPEGTYEAKINAKYEDIDYSKQIHVVLGKNRFSKIKSFFVFYKYYAYSILFILAILLILRRKISNRIIIKYKNYKTRQARLKGLKAARKARQLKKKLKEIETKK
ncbi:MAG: hypothetical protein AABX33_05670 [Nanoarchaeota archaeon]